MSEMLSASGIKSKVLGRQNHANQITRQIGGIVNYGKRRWRDGSDWECVLRKSPQSCVQIVLQALQS